MVRVRVEFLEKESGTLSMHVLDQPLNFLPLHLRVLWWWSCPNGKLGCFGTVPSTVREGDFGRNKARSKSSFWVSRETCEKNDTTHNSEGVKDETQQPHIVIKNGGHLYEVIRNI